MSGSCTFVRRLFALGLVGRLFAVRRNEAGRLMCPSMLWLNLRKVIHLHLLLLLANGLLLLLLANRLLLLANRLLLLLARLLCLRLLLLLLRLRLRLSLLLLLRLAADRSLRLLRLRLYYVRLNLRV